MAIINRLARLFKADFHAVLDHIEEPEQQLKQSIREMQQELNEIEQDILKRKFEISNLTDRKKATEQHVEQAEEEINVCFENNNDDLARGLIRRKLETNSVLKSLAESQHRTVQALSVLENQHKEYVSLLNSMQQKAELLENTRSQQTPTTAQQSPVFTISDDDVEVALLRERQQFKARSAKK